MLMFKVTQGFTLSFIFVANTLIKGGKDCVNNRQMETKSNSQKSFLAFLQFLQIT